MGFPIVKNLQSIILKTNVCLSTTDIRTVTDMVNLSDGTMEK